MSLTAFPKSPRRWWSHPAGQATVAAVLSASVLALTWSLATPARAEEPDPVLPDLRDTYLPPVPADDGLYRALGGQAGIEALVSVFHLRLLADRRVAPFFEGSEAQRFKTELALEFCQVSGGPCSRPRNHRRLHSGMDITRADFNAVVEVLQHSLDVQGVPFGVQARLLAVLAPMHRDIVNTKGDTPAAGF
jgi:hemoglobin